MYEKYMLYVKKNCVPKCIITNIRRYFHVTDLAIIITDHVKCQSKKLWDSKNRDYEE